MRSAYQSYDFLNLSFPIAKDHESSLIADLINSAYRGESSQLGWTSEAHLVEGLRTNSEEIQGLLTDHGSMLVLCKVNDSLVGSMCLQKNDKNVQISMLCVIPELQGLGIGKKLLSAGELAAMESWSINTFQMSVIVDRPELIAFYQRRGYRSTGISKPFPVNPAMWLPKVKGLRLLLMEKRLVCN